MSIRKLDDYKKVSHIASDFQVQIAQNKLDTSVDIDEIVSYQCSGAAIGGLCLRFSTEAEYRTGCYFLKLSSR
jgi:hypothetical protein